MSGNGQAEIISRIFSGEVSLDRFLSDYWQKKPLLIRQAFPDFISPISPEELAGLACEDDSNARIVIEKEADLAWSVKYGPFDEQVFEKLPESNWTLLVSDVEKHIPATKQISNCFRFIPDWRIDDLMFSYAPEGGSVGPHIDAYDVFLLQAYGRRKWMINTKHSNEFLKNTDLKILREFEAEDEWILEPGDLLYLPPDIAHHGVATEPCMTCSIGFRAPSARSIVSEFGEYLASKLADELRYCDKNIQPQEHSAEISQASLSNIENILKTSLITDKNLIQQWFGEYITDSRSSANEICDQNSVINNEQVESILKTNKTMLQAPASRFAFIRNNNDAILFVDGNSYDTSIGFSEELCRHNTVDCSLLLKSIETDMDKSALVDIFNRGSLLLEHD